MRFFLLFLPFWLCLVHLIRLVRLVGLTLDDGRDIPLGLQGLDCLAFFRALVLAMSTLARGLGEVAHMRLYLVALGMAPIVRSAGLFISLLGESLWLLDGFLVHRLAM